MRHLTVLLGAAALLGSAGGALAQQQNAGAPVEANFPDGPGKATVLAVCGSCHDLARLTAGYTPEGWVSVTAMMHNFGAAVPDGQWDTVRAYLIRSFPERPRPEAKLLSGPAAAFIMQWPVPRP